MPRPRRFRRWSVSIRAPERTLGRHSWNDSFLPSQSAFQSGPQSELWGDTTRKPSCHQATRFNPRPRANSGATPGPHGRGAVCLVFQSAPQSELWGDSSMSTRQSRYYRVSIRAPERTLGRHKLNSSERSGSNCFNPRPRANSGATFQSEKDIDNYLVSIRAPERTLGRPARRGNSCDAGQFQSAPQSELWGDQPPHEAAWPPGQFQSAPQSELWGDASSTARGQPPSPFQSAPQSELWGDLSRRFW